MDLFIPSALQIEPRLKEVDFDFCEVMDLETDFAFISGSVVEGFGNSSSDVDIYVVSSKEVGFPDGKKTTYTNSEKGYYYELNWYSQTWHKSVASQINNSLSEDFKYQRIPFSAIKYYYLCSIACPLINQSKYNDLMKAYKKGKALFALEQYYGYLANKCYQAGIELSENHEIEQSYFWYNEAVNYMIDSVLASYGEGYPTEKFRFEKLRRSVGEAAELYKDARRLRYLGNYSLSEYILQSTSFLSMMNINKYYSEDNSIHFKVSGSTTTISLYHDYLILNAGNVYQLDEFTLSVLKLISEGYSSRKELLQHITDRSSDTAQRLNQTLHQLQLEGIIEIA